MEETLVIRNISRLVTMEPAADRGGPLGVIEGAAMRLENERIAWVGRESDLPHVAALEKELDIEGGVILPGLIDCHTHLVHGGFRCDEFNLRSQGKSYREIAEAGGGILSTVRATREALADELLDGAAERADEAMQSGTTTIEIKTGYGLDAATEQKMGEVIAALRDSLPQHIVGTQLGAHVVPTEFEGRREEYVRLVCETMLPEAKKLGVVSACDVFVEAGAFTKDEARAIAGAGKQQGMGLHLHVDQFSDGGGGEFAAELGALSADHLDFTSEAGMRAMASKGVVGVLLPGASFFAGRGRYPDARRMRELGVTLAIATDYNPGTNPSLDLFLAATIAVSQMGLTCDEALMAITRNAARALGLSDVGYVAPGARADLAILDVPHEHFPLYRYGVSFVRATIIGGKLYEESRRLGGHE